jgi:hypothetical protein
LAKTEDGRVISNKIWHLPAHALYRHGRVPKDCKDGRVTRPTPAFTARWPTASGAQPVIVKMTILRLRHFFPKLEATFDKTQFLITSNYFVEATMRPKSLIMPERQRMLAPPFAWVDRRFLLNGFLDTLTPQENLLYFFLVLAADRDGLSFYNYDKICQL